MHTLTKKGLQTLSRTLKQARTHTHAPARTDPRTHTAKVETHSCTHVMDKLNKLTCNKIMRPYLT